MNQVILIIRTLLGLAFVVFGLNFFLKFIPMGGPPPPEAAKMFMGAIAPSGFLAAVKVLEIAGGLALLSKRYAPLGLVILGPIVVNILFYDVFLAKAFNPIGFAVLAMEIFLIWTYRKNFAGLFAAPQE
jgi:putative oxidoreductase